MKKQKAFTLIEILITIVILMIIVTAIYQFFINNFKAVNDEAKKSNIESQVKTVMDNISQKLKMADQSTISYSDALKKVTMVVYDSSGSFYSYGVKYDSTQKAIIIEKNSSFDYYLKGYVDSMQFEFADGRYLKIKFVVDYNLRNYKKEYEIFYNIRID